MVDVLGPWLVPVEAVVSEPTAGARIKSISPSVDVIKRVEEEELNFTIEVRLEHGCVGLPSDC